MQKLPGIEKYRIVSDFNLKIQEKNDGFIQGIMVTGSKARTEAVWRAPVGKVVIARWLYDQGIKLGAPADEMIHIPNGIDH